MHGQEIENGTPSLPLGMAAYLAVVVVQVAAAADARCAWVQFFCASRQDSVPMLVQVQMDADSGGNGEGNDDSEKVRPPPPCTHSVTPRQGLPGTAATTSHSATCVGAMLLLCF